MTEVKDFITADTLDWLLTADDPSVRYFTLRDLLDRPENDAEAADARREIMRSGMVPEILAAEREPEYIRAYPRFYTYKYKGLVWTLLVLAELGATADAQIKAQCEYLLQNAHEPRDGGFSQSTAVRTGGGRISEVIPCLTGNMVWSLIRLGYLDDPRLELSLDWLTRFMRFNDGVETEPQVKPYDRYEMCWGAHTCHMGVVKALKALAAIPAARRSEPMRSTIDRAAEFLLLHHIYKRSHNLNRISKPGWLKFGFPLMYQTDVLEILDILTALGYRDQRMEDAVNLVLAKRDDAGRWRVENTYMSDRLLIPWGPAGEQSKWITLRALRVLRRYYT